MMRGVVNGYEMEDYYTDTRSIRHINSVQKESSNYLAADVRWNGL
mgnify:CR=1 FL=1